MNKRHLSENAIDDIVFAEHFFKNVIDQICTKKKAIELQAAIN